MSAEDSDELTKRILEACDSAEKYKADGQMDEYLKNKFIELYGYMKLVSECETLREEEIAYTAFCCGAVASGAHINSVAPARVIQAYIDGKSPFGFRYP